jgi:hypothetical protein
VIKLLARDSETGRMGTYQTSFTSRTWIARTSASREHGRVEQSARSARRRVVHREEGGGRAGTESTVADGYRLIPSVTRVFSKSRDLYVFLQSYQRRSTTMQR